MNTAYHALSPHVCNQPELDAWTRAHTRGNEEYRTGTAVLVAIILIVFPRAEELSRPPVSLLNCACITVTPQAKVATELCLGIVQAGDLQFFY